jgi:phenylpropionate dioxygenase-like ring-hydroxylating dioxygenase large terminal subunit
MADLVCTERREYDIPCNWKMLVENNMEGYHFLGTHETLGEFGDLKYWRTFEGRGLYNCLAGDYDQPMTMNVGGGVGVASASIPGLTDAEMKRNYYLTLFPNNLWALQPDNVLCLHMIPNGVGHTRWIIHFHFPRSTVELTNFGDISKAAYDAVDSILMQDLVVCDKTYRGYQSQMFRPGRLSLHERNMYGFAQYILARVSNQKFVAATDQWTTAAAGY